MFGVTTPCVQQITAALAADWECLVFHATGVGGRSMEKLIDSGLISGVIDVTTTEVADMLMGGVLPATRIGSAPIIRTRVPYVGSVGALDMVNFGPPDTVPAALQRPAPARAQSAGDADAHDRRRERARSAAGSASASTAWTARCASCCPNLASPRSMRRASRSTIPRPTRAVPRARADGAPDREPAIDPGQAPHQRSRIFRRGRRRVSSLHGQTGDAPARGEVDQCRRFGRSALMEIPRDGGAGRADRRRRRRRRGFPPNARRPAAPTSS
jgi:hypothetical protein